MTRTLSRRRLLNAVAGASVLAITQNVLGSTAMAAPAGGKKSASQKARRAALKAAKAKRPPSRAVGPDDLTPEDRELARALVAKTRHAIASAAAHPDTSFAKGSAAAAAAKFLSGQRPARRSRAKARAQSLLAGASAEREAIFGALADADASEHKTKKKHKQVDDAAKKVHRKKKKKKKNDEHDGPHYEKLEFHLNWVDCNEETDEWSDSDEILLGGHLVTPSGHIETISRFKVSDDFDAGESVLYDYEVCAPFGNEPPPMFDVNCPNGGPDDPYHGRVLAGARVKPGTYALVLLMGEEDTAGGFAGMVADVYHALEKEIDDALMGGASALAGPFGPAIASAVGEVLEWLVGLVDNPDDLLATRTWTLQIVNDSLHKHRTELKPALAAPKGTWACPMRTMQFNGENARYEVGLHWRAMT